MRIGGLDQVLADALEQAAVRGVGDGLGHHGGVHDHPVHAGLLDHAATARGLDGAHQQGLHAFFADALAPARQAGRIDGRFGLQVSLSAEELPVRVLHPGVDHCLIRSIEGVLQVQQPCHQARRQGRAAPSRSERGTEAALDLAPIDQLGHAHQRVLHVDQLIQARDEQIAAVRAAWLGTHGQDLVEICRETAIYNASACNSCAGQTRKSSTPAGGLGIVQGGLSMHNFSEATGAT